MATSRSEIRISHSQVNLFLKCGKQYWFRYKKKLKRRPPGAVKVGSWGHETMARNFNAQIREGEQLSMTEFCGDWETRFGNGILQEDIDWGDFNPGQYKTSFLGSRLMVSPGVPGGATQERQGLLPVIRRAVTPKLEPRLVEHRFEINIPERDGTESNIWVLGFIDFYGLDGEGKLSIHDWKFKRNHLNQPAADNDGQMTLYDLALKAAGEKVEGVCLDSFAHGPKIPSVRSFPMQRIESDHERLITEYREIARQIESLGDDPEKYPFARRIGEDSNWVCTERFCGFRSLCPRGGGNYEE